MTEAVRSWLNQQRANRLQADAALLDDVHDVEDIDALYQALHRS